MYTKYKEVKRFFDDKKTAIIEPPQNQDGHICVPSLDVGLVNLDKVVDCNGYCKVKPKEASQVR